MSNLEHIAGVPDPPGDDVGRGELERHGPDAPQVGEAVTHDSY